LLESGPRPLFEFIFEPLLPVDEFFEVEFEDIEFILPVSRPEVGVSASPSELDSLGPDSSSPVMGLSRKFPASFRLVLTNCFSPVAVFIS
jgi:hypothetical protein